MLIPISKSRAYLNEAPVLECTSLLAAAVGQNMDKYMEGLLDPMFACGLTEPLTQALVDMAHYIPQYKHEIQTKLLDLLSIILSGNPFKPVGCPDNKLPPLPSFAQHFNLNPSDRKDPEIVLALHTLGSFDFSGETLSQPYRFPSSRGALPPGSKCFMTGHILNEFVRDVAIRYVENDNAEIRKAAALTCCQLFLDDPVLKQKGLEASRIVADVISKLLNVALSDPEWEIRFTILQSLDAKFDQQLANKDMIHRLFFAVHDENTQVREAAISIIGRLTAINPAYVFPRLRKLLMNLLLGVRYNNSATQKEDSAQMIALFVKNATGIIEGYIQPIVSIMLPRAKEPNTGVASAALMAMGEAATVGSEEMKNWIPELMPIIIDSLQDLSSNTRRLTALKTLSQISFNCGYVIDPYIDHPKLLAILTNIIKSEQPGPLRKETIKLLGVIGALDPYRYQVTLDPHYDCKDWALMYQQQVVDRTPEQAQYRVEADTVTDVTLIMSGLTPSNDEYYPTIVINTLLQSILRDHSLTQHHPQVVGAIIVIFRTLGLKCVPFLGQIVPAFLTVIRNSQGSLLDSYFNQLALLVTIVKQHIRAFINDIVVVIQEFWDTSPQLQSTILGLIESISNSIEGEFKTYLAPLLPNILDVFETDKTPNRQPTQRILSAFLVFGYKAQQYMHLFIPYTVRLFASSKTPPHIRRLAMETVQKMTKQVYVGDYAAFIIQALATIISSRDEEDRLKQAALNCICAMIHQIGVDFTIFKTRVNKVCSPSRVELYL